MRREPAFWVSLGEAALALLLTLNLLPFTEAQSVLIMAVVMAGLGVYTAWRTRDTMLGVGIGLAKAVLALGVGFGLSLTEPQTTAIIAFVTIALGAFQRSQTSPLAVGTFREVGPT
jgi:hypothetical protein